MMTRLFLSISRAEALEGFVTFVSRLVTLACYTWISTFLDLEDVSGQPRTYRQERTGRRTSQVHDYVTLGRVWPHIPEYACGNPTAVYEAVKDLEIACYATWYATKTALKYELQNKTLNREAAMNWVQAQQRTLICSLRSTVLILRVGRSAWQSTKRM
jgi:hypothetical protein